MMCGQPVIHACGRTFSFSKAYQPFFHELLLTSYNIDASSFNTVVRYIANSFGFQSLNMRSPILGVRKSRTIQERSRRPLTVRMLVRIKTNWMRSQVFVAINHSWRTSFTFYLIGSKPVFIWPHKANIRSSMVSAMQRTILLNGCWVTYKCWVWRDKYHT